MLFFFVEIPKILDKNVAMSSSFLYYFIYSIILRFVYLAKLNRYNNNFCIKTFVQNKCTQYSETRIRFESFNSKIQTSLVQK